MDKQHSGKAATASIFAQTYQNPLPKIGASFGMKVAAWRIVGLYCPVHLAPRAGHWRCGTQRGTHAEIRRPNRLRPNLHLWHHFIVPYGARNAPPGRRGSR